MHHETTILNTRYNRQICPVLSCNRASIEKCDCLIQTKCHGILIDTVLHLPKKV